MGMKKLVALVMALMLCLTAVSAMAAVDVDTFAEFEAAVHDASVTEINVTADITDGKGVVFNQPKTIDFGGHTYTFVSNAVGSTGTTTLGFQLLKGSNKVTLKNGTLTTKAGSGVKRLLQVYCQLEIVDMTLDGSNLDAHQDKSPNTTVSFCNGLESSITGDSTVIATDDGNALGVYDYSTNGYTGVSLTVDTNGEIIGGISVSADNADDADAKLSINKMSADSVIPTITVSEGEAQLPNELPVGTKVVVGEKATLKDEYGSFDVGEGFIVPEMTYENDKPYKNDLVFKGSGTLTVESTDHFENVGMIQIVSDKVMNGNGGYPALLIYNDNGNPDGDYPNLVVGKDKPHFVAEFGNIDDVTVSKGSIQVTMSEKFLKTLEPGKYHIGIGSVGGFAKGTFTVESAPAAPVDLPQTGDNSSLMLWSAMLALAAAGFVVTRKTRLN